jgi:putative transposase
MGGLEMKAKRYTEEQIIGILKEHEAGVKGADWVRKHGVSEKASTGGSRSTAACRGRQQSG